MSATKSAGPTTLANHLDKEVKTDVLGAIDSDKLTEAAQGDHKAINEEYKIWKKNSPYLYNVVIATVMDHPTLTVEWLPDLFDDITPGSMSARLMFGSHSSGLDKDYIHVASVELPTHLRPETIGLLSKQEGGTDMKQHHDAHGRHKRIAIVQSIYEDGEVNVARYNPLASKQIAAAHVTGDIHIFDRNNIMNSKEEAKPIYNLKHHTKEGWGLNWNINHADQLVSGAIDSTVAYWKIPEAASDGTCKDVTPHTVYHHDGAVNDVKFSYKMDFLIGSASDDCTLRLWDTRKDGNKAACTIKESRGINSLDFNPHSEFLVATGSADETVKVWDMRRMDTPISQLYSHCDEVTKVQWCPHQPSVLASGGHDRAILVWDIARLHDDLSSDENDEGPPELLFHHGGHSSRISDFDWHPTLPWVIASAAEDNVIQVWRMAESISNDEAVPADDVDMED